MNPWANLDLLTRLWWRLWGQAVHLEGSESWLVAPGGSLLLHSPRESRGGVGTYVVRFLGLRAVRLHDRLERRR